MKQDIEDIARQQVLTDETASIARNAGYGLIGLVFSSLLAYVNSAILTRYLGASDYGLYVLVTQFVLLLGTLVSLGLPIGTVRFISFYAGQGSTASIKGSLYFSMTLVAVISIVAGLLLFIFSEPIAIALGYEEAGPLLRILVVFLPVGSLLTLALSALTGLKLVSWQVGLEYFSKPLIWLALLLLIIQTAQGITGVIWAFNLLAILLLLMAFWLISHHFTHKFRAITPVYEGRKLLRFSAPLYVNDLISQAILFVPLYFLGIWASSAEIGIYNISYKISILVGLLSTTAFLRIFGPTISSLYARNEKAVIHSLLRTTSKWIMSISISIFIILTYYGKSLLGFFGEEFKEGEVALVILLAGQLVFAITGPAAAVLLMSGRPRLIMINALIHFGLTLLLCLFMIKPFGLQGAVVSVCISMGLMPLFYLVPLYRHERMTPFSIKYFKHLLSAVCGLAGMILTSSIFNNNPILSFVLGLLAYAVLFAICLLLLKPDAEDQIVIDKLKQKFGWR